MSIHVCCDWDGISDLKDRHVNAIVDALRANHAQLGNRWLPPAFAVLSPGDHVLSIAADVLDTVDGPSAAMETLECVLAVEAALQGDTKGDFAEHVRETLSRVFKRLEEIDE